jgi:beta propeller repeat protein
MEAVMERILHSIASSSSFAVLCAIALCSCPAQTALARSGPFQAFPIATTPGHEGFAKIDGRYVVWTDVAFLGGPPNSSNDVIGYDLLTQQTLSIANGPLRQDDVAVSGDTAVWFQSNRIVGRRLPGGATFNVSSGSAISYAPAISGNNAVWQDERNGSPQVWCRRLDQPAGSDFPVSSLGANSSQIFPDISGNVATWMSFQEPGDQGNIYARDLTTGGIFPVTTRMGYQFYPKISGRTVIWNDASEDNWTVWGKNLDSGNEFQISSGAGDQYYCAIDGDLVVWRDDRSAESDIWGRYLSGGPEFQITNTPGIWEDRPDVSGNVVIWEQGSDPNTDIFGTVVPEPCASGLLAISISAIMRRRRA